MSKNNTADVVAAQHATQPCAVYKIKYIVGKSVKKTFVFGGTEDNAAAAASDDGHSVVNVAHHIRQDDTIETIKYKLIAAGMPYAIDEMYLYSTKTESIYDAQVIRTVTKSTRKPATVRKLSQLLPNIVCSTGDACKLPSDMAPSDIVTVSDIVKLDICGDAVTVHPFR